MAKRLFGFLGGAGLFIASFAFTPAATAQQVNYFNYELYGTFAVQFTGTVNLPSPLDGYNGPFSRNGKVVFDGYGHFTATVIANYSGTILHDNFTGTYAVNSDGTFSLQIANLTVPFLPPGAPNVFSFDGILADNGHSAKITLDGVSVGGQQQTNVGSVIVGTLSKQTY